MATQDPWEYGSPQQFHSSPYPVPSIANALANIVNTWSGKRQKDKYTQALASALAPQPVDNVGITPQITGPGQFQQREMSGAYNQPTERDIFSKLLDTGNPDVTAQFGPLALQSQIQSQAQANAPITPYQRANLGQQASNAQATRDAAKSNLEATHLFTAEQGDLNRQNARDIADIRAKSALGSAGNVQSMQQIQLDDGRSGFLTVYRNGKHEITSLDGAPVISSQRDPGALFNQNAARAGGTASGTAAANQPTVDGSYQMMKDTLASFQDPAVKKEAGNALNLVGSNLPTIPGINSNFISHLKQLQGQTFLQAYNSLKGGGSITEVEGEKATAAIGRLQRAQTTGEFYNSLKDAETEIDKLYALAKQRAVRGQVVPQMQGAAAVPMPAPAKNNDPLGLR